MCYHQAQTPGTCRISLSKPGWSGTHYGDQTGFELGGESGGVGGWEGGTLFCSMSAGIKVVNCHICPEHQELWNIRDLELKSWAQNEGDQKCESRVFPVSISQVLQLWGTSKVASMIPYYTRGEGQTLRYIDGGSLWPEQRGECSWPSGSCCLYCEWNQPYCLPIPL